MVSRGRWCFLKRFVISDIGVEELGKCAIACIDKGRIASVKERVNVEGLG